MKSLILGALYFLIFAANWNGPVPWAFDQDREDYFRWQVEQIEQKNDLTNWTGKEELEKLQREGRKQLYEMLGLDPIPEKTPLRTVVTGTIEYDSFVVEKLYFESIPGLFVTANLYRPKVVTGSLPAILYVCGHATVKADGYNFGSKVHYQHHPAWYAKNGYICLILDTVELGEIEGIHHGTYRHERWWWNSRGYTPAGVEAWNGIRAIDYLLSRSEVAKDKIGVTGRSGGGATSWWVGALDTRVQVVVPVAGVTDLHNQVVDGCVGGHCDCMFYLNTHRWDFSKLGMLIAPRPLLIANSDRDPIFPLDGVYRVHQAISEVYAKLDVSENLALNIVGGGHHDVQEIQVHAFRWFNHFLKGHEELIDIQAKKYFDAEKLRVYEKLPVLAINDRVDEVFVQRAASLSERLSEVSYEQLREEWMSHLTEDVFGCWPTSDLISDIELMQSLDKDDVRLDIYRVKTDRHTHLPFLVLSRNERAPSTTEVQILDDENWPDLAGGLKYLFAEFDLGTTAPDASQGNLLLAKLDEHVEIVFMGIRGAGPARFSGDKHEQTQIKRRYALIGQTLESMQTWDIYQHFLLLKTRPLVSEIYASKQTAIMTIYASIFASGQVLHLDNPSQSHEIGPAYPGVLKYFDIPAAMLLCAGKNELHLANADRSMLAGAEDLLQDRKRFQLNFE